MGGRLNRGGTFEQQLPLAKIARQRCRTLKFRTAFVEAPELTSIRQATAKGALKARKHETRRFERLAAGYAGTW